MLSLEQFYVGWPPRNFPIMHVSKNKACKKDSWWFVGTTFTLINKSLRQVRMMLPSHRAGRQGNVGDGCFDFSVIYYHQCKNLIPLMWLCFLFLFVLHVCSLWKLRSMVTNWGYFNSIKSFTHVISCVYCVFENSCEFN